MTINNSGGAKYDGQPKPPSIQQRGQFGESLDDIMPNDIEMPKRKDVSATEYPSTVPAPKYTTEEKK